MKKIIFSILTLTTFFLTSCQQEESFQNETNEQTAQSEIKMCTFDLVNSTSDSTDVATRAVISKNSKWANGATIRIKFMNGTSYLQNKVKQFANQWTSYANLKFVWVSSTEAADLRIAFKWNGDAGSWSYIGTDCKYIAQTEPTMNFGWFNILTSDTEFSRTVIHEFGHALGLKHEQQHPLNTISWNKPVVYAYYAKQGWDKNQVDLNVFSKISVGSSNYSSYDKNSIMHYPIDPALTTNGYSVGWNTVLSATDKQFIAAQYPR